MVAVALLLVAGGVAFKVTRPAPVEPKKKIAGTVYVLPRDFLLNLKDGRFARLSVALVLEAEEAAAEGGGHGAAPAAEPPEGYGTEPQEALVRSIVTDLLTRSDSKALLRAKERERMKDEIREEIERRSDIKATAVLFTDLAVQ